MAYDPASYPPFAVTVDLAVFTVENRKLMVSLVRRGEPPFQGSWALPGGFVGVDEGLETAARRELAEETGLVTPTPSLAQFGAYGSPDRDPRMRVVTVGYWAILPDLPEPRGGSDAAAARMAAVDQMLSSPEQLAFDHHLILSDAREHARRALETTTVAVQFCRDEFTIRELRQVYEAVWGTDLDPGNFQNKVAGIPGFLVPTGNRRPNQRGRPPELYRAGPATEIYPPFRQPSPSADA